MNRNVVAFQSLYEAALTTLHEQVGAHLASNLPLGDPQESLRNQVRWVHDLAKAMVFISQIEKARVANPAPPPVAQPVRNTQSLKDFNPPPPTQPHFNLGS